MKRNIISLVFFLTRTEFTTRHAASSWGLFWTFFSPLASILVIWVALDLGLGMRQSLGPNYGRGLAIGLAAWLFLSGAVIAATSAISGSPHLVKKVVFPVYILPAAKVLCQLIIHTFIILVIIAVVIWSSSQSGWHNLYIIPTVMISTLIAMCFSLLAATLQVVQKDTQAVIGLLTGLLFWLTPIIWPLSNVPQSWHWLVYINPLTLVMDMYRLSILGTAIPVAPEIALMSLASLAVVGPVAIGLFRRLRPLFADVL
jgi:lipopolysaccharide transport system permease protein